MPDARSTAEGPGTARADIYALGKVLYEISTGKDLNSYPELPSDLGNTTTARDVVRFNKIVLNACRTNPRLRYRDAEEMMSALLAFQFSQRDPHAERLRQNAVSVMTIFGLLVAMGVITFLIWKIAWFLLHSN